MAYEGINNNDIPSDSALAYQAVPGYLNYLGELSVAAVKAIREDADEVNGLLNSISFQIDQFSPNDLNLESLVISPNNAPNFTPLNLKPVQVNIPNLNTNVPHITKPSGTFSEDISKPNIDLPSNPSIYSPDLSEHSPHLDVAIVFPDDPNVVIPDAPVLSDIDLPTPPTLNLPTIEDLPRPSTDNLPSIPTSFNFSFTDFDQSNLDTLRDSLVDIIKNGKHGLPQNIVDDLWGRAKDREIKLEEKTLFDIKNDNARAGFYRPSASYQAAIDQARLELSRKLSDISREIAIKQQELLNENFKFATQNLLSAEQTAFSLFETQTRLLFEIEKEKLDYLIKVYDVARTKVLLDLEVYRGYYDAIRIRFQAALSQLEVYKGELEGARVKGELRQQDLQLYLGKLEAAKAAVDVVASKMQVIKDKLIAQGQVVSNFKEKVAVEALKTETNLNQLRATQVAASNEMLKEDIRQGDVKAYLAKLEAFARIGQLDATKGELEIRENTAQLAAVEANIKSNLAKLDAAIKTNQQSLDIAKIETERQNLLNQFQESALRASLAVIDQKNKAQLLERDYAFKKHELNTNILFKKFEAMQDFIKAKQNVDAQLAASSLSALNVGASIGISSHEGINYNISAETSKAF